MDTGFEVERARANGQLIQVAQTFFEQRGFGIGPDTSPTLTYASANTDDDEGTAVAYTALPAAPPAPARVTPPPSERPAAIVRADLPADVTAILNGGTAPARTPALRPGRRRGNLPASPRAAGPYRSAPSVTRPSPATG